jgi:hypothetical protein
MLQRTPNNQVHKQPEFDVFKHELEQLPKLDPNVLPSVIAKVWLSAKLDTLNVAAEKLELFKNRNLTVLGKFELLRHVDSGSRVNFLREVAEHALLDHRTRGVLSSNICQMSFFLDKKEKVQVISSLLSAGRRSGASAIIGQIIMSSRTRDEAISLINKVGYDKLSERRSSVLKEILAICYLGKSLVSLSMPTTCSKYVSHKGMLHKKYLEIQAVLNKAIAYTNEPEYKGTSTRREYNQAMRTALKCLQKSYIESREAASVKGMREAINVAILRYSLEARYVLTLTGSKAAGGVEARIWNADEIRQVTSVLTKITEGLMLFTPRVFEIQRVAHFTGDYAYAAATIDDYSGCIQLTDITFLSSKNSLNTKDQSSLSYFLLHELGHALSGSLMKSSKEVGSSGNQNNFHSYIFGEDFFDLSGWEIEKLPYEIIDGGKSVKLGHRVHALDTLVEVNGKIREYRYNETYKTLYFHRGMGNYTSSYARTDPYEDWADTFSAYACSTDNSIEKAPENTTEKLIEKAPEKFLYMECLFRLYDSNKEMLNYLVARSPLSRLPARVEGAGLSSEHHISLKLFNRLSLIERHALAAVASQANDLQSMPVADMVSSYLSTSEQSLTRNFLRRLDRHPRRARSELQQILETYNPSVLKALQLLEKGHRLAIFADRGDSAIGERVSSPAQNPLREALSSFLGDYFDPSLLYLLSDPHKSARLNKSSNVEKAATILAEFARGSSVRAGGIVKPRRYLVERIHYYDVSSQRISQISQILKTDGLLAKFTFTNVKQYVAQDLAEQLLKTVPGSARNDLHVFALDGCLVNLDPRYRVIYKETGQVLREIKLNEYFLNPDPEYWIANAVAQFSGLPKRNLRKAIQWDDGDFFDSVRVRNQVRSGLELNRMFRN